MSRHAGFTRRILLVTAISVPATAMAWTPYGYDPYGPGPGADRAPAGTGPAPSADQPWGSGMPPAPGYPAYGYGYPPQPPYPPAQAPGTDGYDAGPAPQPPGYPPFGSRQGFPDMGGPGFGPRQGPLRISRRMTEDAYIIEVPLEGLSAEEVQVTTQGNWISIGRDQSRQDVKEDTFDQGRGYARSYSFSSGSANRRFSVPRDADVSAMTREESDGTLRISIPRQRQ